MNRIGHFVMRLSLVTMVGLLPTVGEAKPEWANKPLERDPKEGVAPCDWLELHAQAAGGAIQIAFRCAEPIDFAKGAAYCVFIDIDGKRQTGFRGGEDNFPIGADYLLQGATLYRYAADGGTEWSWSLVGDATYSLAEDWVDYTIPADQMPVNGTEIDIFLLGDNTAPGVDGDKGDVMPDGALRAGGGGQAIRVPTAQKP